MLAEALRRAEGGEPIHAVVIWKVDRLARSVLDLLRADESLRGGIVAVADPVDLTTPQGRAFATVLAVFAELEAAGIAARVKDARRALITQGRRAGGRPPYGFRNVPNPEPEGAGRVGSRPRRRRVRPWGRTAGHARRQSLLDRPVARRPRRPRRARAGREHDTWAEESVEVILRSDAEKRQDKEDQSAAKREAREALKREYWASRSKEVEPAAREGYRSRRFCGPLVSHSEAGGEVVPVVVEVEVAVPRLRPAAW